MIQFYVDGPDLAYVKHALGAMSNEAKPTLKRALNDTARKARKALADKARETYDVKVAGFNQGMRIENATNARLYATILASGRPLELYGYKVSPARYATGAQRPPFIRARVLKSNSLKKVEKGGIKAFVVKYASGHRTVATRTGPGRAIKTLHSPGVPTMIGSKHVYETLAPEIGSMLQQALARQIDRTLRKGALGL